MVLLDQREKQASILRNIQKYRNPVFDAYFAIADVCGDEIFFVLFLPFCVWVMGNHRLALHMAVLIPLCIGGGNYLKNIFQIPRPSGVWVADGVQRQDHGFPSTHTITAIAAPLYFFVYHYVDHAQAYAISMTAGIVMTFMWSSSVIFSRLYNGFHSPQDVAFGFVLGWVAFFSWYYYGRAMIDSWVFSVGKYIPMVTTILGGIILMWMHPRPLEPTPCVAETAVVVGTATGAVLSFQFLENYRGIGGFFEPVTSVATSAVVEWIRFYPVLFYITRYLLGAAVVLLVRILLKKNLKQLFQILGITSSAQNNEVPVKFSCYLVVSMTVLLLVPGLFVLAGLHNATDYCPYGTSCQ